MRIHFDSASFSVHSHTSLTLVCLKCSTTKSCIATLTNHPVRSPRFVRGANRSAHVSRPAQGRPHCLRLWCSGERALILGQATCRLQNHCRRLSVAQQQFCVHNENRRTPCRRVRVSRVVRVRRRRRCSPGRDDTESAFGGVTGCLLEQEYVYGYVFCTVTRGNVTGSAQRVRNNV